jgi:hypothetical protein
VQILQGLWHKLAISITWCLCCLLFLAEVPKRKGVCEQTMKTTAPERQYKEKKYRVLAKILWGKKRTVFLQELNSALQRVMGI